MGIFVLAHIANLNAVNHVEAILNNKRRIIYGYKIAKFFFL